MPSPVPWLPLASLLRSCCSVAESCLTLCNPTDCSIGFPVLHCLPEFAQFLAPPIISSSSSSHPLCRLLPSGIQHARCQLGSWNNPAMVPPLPPLLVQLSRGSCISLPQLLSSPPMDSHGGCPTGSHPRRFLALNTVDTFDFSL